MNKESVAKYVKAVAAVGTCIGIVIAPEQQEALVAGFLAVYSVVSAVQGKLLKK